jgi:hypothetical protein
MKDMYEELKAYFITRPEFADINSDEVTAI